MQCKTVFFAILYLLLALWRESQGVRVVVTFANSTEGISHIPANTTLIKKYGRRLVLDVADLESLNRSLSEEWPDQHVLFMEEDLSIAVAGLNLTSSGVYIQDIIMNGSIAQGGDVEWQFAAGEPFSTQAELAWNLNITGENLTVAVIDSGLAAQVQEVGLVFKNLVPGYDFISSPDHSLDGDGRDPDPTDPGDDGEDCPAPTWHGTKVASSLAGIHGILPGFHSTAPDCTLQMIRVLGLCGVGYSNDLADAIVYAAGGFINGLEYNPTPARIISLSIAGLGLCPSYLQSAINLAVVQRGVLIVAAAGNAGGNAMDYFPANCQNVLVVGATTRSGVLASYSNHGEVHLAAPGGDETSAIRVLTVAPDGQLALSNVMGTSFSVVFTAGVAALYGEMLNNHSGSVMGHAVQASSMVCEACGGHLLRFNGSYVEDGLEEVPVSNIIPGGSMNGQVLSFRGQAVCPAGQYEITEDVCVSCPEGTYSTQIGMTSVSACLPCSTCNSFEYVELSCNASQDTICSRCSETGIDRMFLSENTGHRIRRIRILNGTTEIIAGNGTAGTGNGIGTSATMSSPYQMIMNRNGTTLFVRNPQLIRTISLTDADGLYRVNTLTGSASTYTDGDFTVARFRNLGFMAFSADERFMYVTDASTTRRVRRLDMIARTVTSIAGNGSSTPSCPSVGTPMANIAFNTPMGIVVFQRSPIIIVGDQILSVFFVISLESETIISIIGECGNSSFADGIGTNAKFNQPREILVNAAEDTLFVNDANNFVFRKITYPGLEVTTIAGIIGNGVYRDGPIPAVGTITSTTVSFHVSFNGTLIYFGDGNRLRMIDYRMNPANITTIANSPGTTGGQDGPFSVASFSNIRGIRQLSCPPPPICTQGRVYNRAYDCVCPAGQYEVNATCVSCPAGTYSTGIGRTSVNSCLPCSTCHTFAYVELSCNASQDTICGRCSETEIDRMFSCDFDSNANRIRRIRLNGTVETIAGNGSNSNVDGIGTMATFSTPYQTMMNANGTTLYVRSGTVIRAISLTDADGLYRVTTLTGSTSGYQDGDFAVARFRSIGFFSFSAGDQFMYTTDASSTRRVRRLDMVNRVVTSIAGSGSASPSCPSIGTAMTSINLNNPTGIVAFKKSPILLVTDQGFSAIFVISLTSETVIAIIGSCNNASFADGIGTAAGFNQPRETLVNADETVIYVNDVLNFVFRRVAYPALEVSTIAGRPLISGTVDGSIPDVATISNNAFSFYVSSNGSLIYFGDNHRLRKIDYRVSPVNITTIIGGTLPGAVDGPFSVASLAGVRGVRQLSCPAPVPCEPWFVHDRNFICVPNTTTTTTTPTPLVIDLTPRSVQPADNTLSYMIWGGGLALASTAGVLFVSWTIQRLGYSFYQPVPVRVYTKREIPIRIQPPTLADLPGGLHEA